MNWDAMGAVGEVVGALAVVISIVYLAIQIRQNTQTTKLSVEIDISKSFSTSLTELSSTNLPYIFFRGLDDLEQLTDEEAAQFGFYVAIELMRQN